MPAPTGIVLYTFMPPGDSWTGEYMESLTHDHTEITDAYDYHKWRDSGWPWNRLRVYNYVQTTNAGPIKRLRCTFSIDFLPGTSSEPLFGIAYSTDLGITQPDWINRVDTTIYLFSTGKLAFASTSTQSVNAISAGTSYELELYVYNDPARANSTWQIWIDGTLWLEDTTQQDVAWFGIDTWTYLEFMSGFAFAGPRAPTGGGETTTLHVESIIFTIEHRSTVGWTMMAPGIA